VVVAADSRAGVGCSSESDTSRPGFARHRHASIHSGNDGLSASDRLAGCSAPEPTAAARHSDAEADRERAADRGARRRMGCLTTSVGIDRSRRWRLTFFKKSSTNGVLKLGPSKFAKVKALLVRVWGGALTLWT